MDSPIFDAADDVIRKDVPGDANDEEITEALVEDQLDGNARVTATEDYCKGALTGYELMP